MSLVATPAVLLHAFPYGETSKIVRLLTPEYGVLSAIAKGAHRNRSRFAARLQPLSEGTAQVYVRQHRDLHTLAEFDADVQHEGLAKQVVRFAAATALAELVMRCAPPEPDPEIHRLVSDALRTLETCPEEALAAESLRALWAAIVVLGFAPSVDACARDGRALRDGPVAFSVPDGGFLCAACARSGSATTTLPVEDRALLADFVAGSDSPVESLDSRRAAAHRRLLGRFVERHLAEGRELKALALWQALA